MISIHTIFLISICTTVLASPIPDPSYVPENNEAIKSTANVLVDTDIKNSASELQVNLEPNNNEIVDINETTTTEQIPNADGGEEDMETAHMIIFRPLFVYRRKTAQKYRIQNGNANRRYYRPQQYIYCG